MARLAITGAKRRRSGDIGLGEYPGRPLITALTLALVVACAAGAPLPIAPVGASSIVAAEESIGEKLVDATSKSWTRRRDDEYDQPSVQESRGATRPRSAPRSEGHMTVPRSTPDRMLGTTPRVS